MKSFLIVAAAGSSAAAPLRPRHHPSDLEVLVAPFVVLFVILAFLTRTPNLHTVAHGAAGPGWSGWHSSSSLSGWVDRERQRLLALLPRDAPKSSIVGWVFVGTFIP